MSAFTGYARHYDVLYADKDYAGEVDYVVSLIAQQCPKALTVLDLGCGTGRHAVDLARRGYRVLGVDASDAMLELATRRSVELEIPADQLAWSRGDVRSFRAGKEFDVVLALFHVASYQTTADDLSRFLATAATHLRPGGVFILDFWYGPAVLSEQPSVRIKRADTRDSTLLRIAEPILYPNHNCVEVHYTLLVSDKRTSTSETITETHRMRYLFVPEVEALMLQVGLRSIRCEQWLTGRSPAIDTWSVAMVASQR